MTRARLALLVSMGVGLLAAAAFPRDVAPSPVIVVEMHEFRFRPAVIRLQVGRPATLRFVNRGQIAHQIETSMFGRVPVSVTDAESYIEAPGLSVLRVQPGAAATLQFVARVRGRFPFACTIEGHQEAGMSGVFVIP